VVEVPEHLLRRSRERREALGLSPGGERAAEPSEAGEAPAGDEEEAAPAPAAAAARTPAPAPAAPPVEAVPPKPPPPPPPYIQAALRRKRIPVWVTPVLLALPVWAWIYAGVLATPSGPADPVLAEGQQLFSSQCAVCHGDSGQGGVGPALANGEVLKTFPDPEMHIEWVKGGSDSVGVGNPYGDPERGRVAKGGMPAFEGQLDEDQIAAVVRYEREVLGGEEAAGGAGGEAESEGGGGEAADH